MYANYSNYLIVRSLYFKCRPILSSCCVVLPRVATLNENPSFPKQIFTTGQLWKANRSRTFPSLKEKYLKAQSKKESTQVHEVWDKMSTKDLAKVLSVDTDEVFELILTIDDNLIDNEFQPINDWSVMKEIAKKLRCKFKRVPDPNKNPSQDEAEENHDVVHIPPKLEDLQPRPPICAIVGHIDHGKTTLLDYLRKSSVVSIEHGGITQHIGAFSVALPNQDGTSTQNVTFLDTPGHAAFKNMRIRGAHVTDIVILVVDASEGPLEQTYESIAAVKAARVSLIVAINKIDKPGANIERTKKALFDAGVQLEDFGGDVQAVPISALTGTNVTLLIEAILAQAEVLQLAGDYKGPVEGTVIESSIDPGLGKTAIVLIRRGTLRKGDVLVCGVSHAKVRLLLNTGATLEDEKSYQTELKEVRPSEACKIVGWKELPHAGGEVLQVENEKRAHQVIHWRHQEEARQKVLEDSKEIEKKRDQERQKYVDFRMKKLDAGVMRLRYGRYDFYTREKEVALDDGQPKVSLVIKADVDGSLEAIMGCLQTYNEKAVDLDIIHVGIGAVTETDLKLAQDFDGIVYSFNANLSDKMRQSASFLKVQVKEFNVIYNLIDDLKLEINNKIPAADVEVPIGRGRVLKEFLLTERNKKIPVAGCRVSSGKFDKAKLFRIIRNGKQVIYNGSLQSLRHLKDEVPLVSQGQECGLRFQDPLIRFEDRDEILCYEMTKESRFTTWSPGF